jgi:hypothetical protein
LIKLSKEVQDSREIIIVNFLIYKEDWLAEKIRTNNRAHESLLKDKYQHVYLYDSDINFHVEWSTFNHTPIYAVIPQLDDGDSDDEDLVSYHINENLYKRIQVAPAPYNQQRRLIN